MKKIVKSLLYEKSLASLKLWGKAMARLKENKYGMVYTLIFKKDFGEGAQKKDLEGLANYISCLPYKKAILLLSEEEGKIHGSLRTQRDDVDVSKLAFLFGAGGHQKAAGFTIPGKLVETENGWKVI
jgi:phosphoesterase RecJ-like protein